MNTDDNSFKDSIKNNEVIYNVIHDDGKLPSFIEVKKQYTIEKLKYIVNQLNAQIKKLENL